MLDVREICQPEMHRRWITLGLGADMTSLFD